MSPLEPILRPITREKLKELAEAYATLKDPEKRAEYDQLDSRRPGEDFSPPERKPGAPPGGGVAHYVGVNQWLP